MAALMRMEAEQIEYKFEIYFEIDLKEPEELRGREGEKAMVARLIPMVFDLSNKWILNLFTDNMDFGGKGWWGHFSFILGSGGRGLMKYACHFCLIFLP